MMLLGVGGCAALVVTGFGIKDSIVGIADYQFEQVTLYDLAVTFSQDQGAGAQEDFRDACAGVAEDMMFLYESTADLTVGGKTKSVYFLASEADMSGFVDLHRGKEPVAFPGTNQAVLNNGLAEALNLEVGDTVTLRTADLDTLSLTVSGILTTMYTIMSWCPPTRSGRNGPGSRRPIPLISMFCRSWMFGKRLPLFPTARMSSASPFARIWPTG